MTATQAPKAPQAPPTARARRIGARRVWALTAGAAVAVIALAAATALLPDPLLPVPADRLLPPSAGHPFGTDHLGRDVLGRVVHAGWFTLALAVAGAAMAVAVGVAMALIAGFEPGRVPAHATELAVQTLLAFPSLWLPLVIVAVIGTSSTTLVFTLVLVGLPQVYWVVRGDVTQLCGQPFVEAARALGYSRARILAFELTPHVWPTARVLALLQLRRAVLVVSALAFLGLGPGVRQPTWGLMIAEGRDALPADWWPVAFPALALAVVVVCAGAAGRRLDRKEIR